MALKFWRNFRTAALKQRTKHVRSLSKHKIKEITRNKKPCQPFLIIYPIKQKYPMIYHVTFYDGWSFNFHGNMKHSVICNVNMGLRYWLSWVTGLTGQDFFFSCQLYFFPHSFSSSYFLPLFHCLISILLFPFASVWENTRAWVPHFL